DDVAPVLLLKRMVTAGSPEILVKVDRGIEIQGRLIHADGTPAAGTIVEVPTTVTSRSAIAAADGTFRLRGARSGPGSVQAFSADHLLFSPVVKVNSPASNVTITMPRGVRLQGRILDRATQKPVNDFVILLPSRNRLSNGGSDSGGKHILDNDGRYSLENISPGTLEIVVRAAGYAEGSRTGIAAEDGKTISGIDFQLDRAGRLTGRVTAASKPVAGVHVILDEKPHKPGASKSITDAEGVYAFEGVAAGDHQLRFEKLGFVAINKALSITEPKELRLDVVLDAGHELRGRVVDRSGRGVPDVSVSAGSGSAETDDEGAFVVRGLPEGQYQVRIHKFGFLPAETKFDLPQTQPLIFTLDPGATISGRVIGVPPEQLTRVTVIGDDGAHVHARAAVDAQGNFAIPGMPEGRVRIEAWLASRQAPSKTVVVQNGVAPFVEMNFAEGITVSGRVSRNGLAPSPNGMITFVPSPQTDDPPPVAPIAADGSYEVSGLRAGEYAVQIAGPGFGYKTRYTATGSGRFDIDMRTARLRGRVIDSISGAPIADAHILVSNTQGYPQETNSEGRFTVDGLDDGPHFLEASRQGYVVVRPQVVVSNGSVPDAEVRLEPIHATIIHVIDAATGAPVHADLLIFSVTEPGLIFPAVQAEGEASKVWVKPGPYKIGIHADGYPAKMLDVTIAAAEVNVTIAR
ncbi:MAG TPA: carboxypeptidase-like regulatory domain-containing protein, partial [Thermoanaerobaculia bacterium]